MAIMIGHDVWLSCLSYVTVMSDLLAAHVKIDVDHMKTELDLHKKYIICEQLGRCALPRGHFMCRSHNNKTSDTAVVSLASYTTGTAAVLLHWPGEFFRL